MKCPNCGAEIGNNQICEFCGSQITLAMKKAQEQLNKKGCPKCGSSNISFNRENHNADVHSAFPNCHLGGTRNFQPIFFTF